MAVCSPAKKRYFSHRTRVIIRFFLNTEIYHCNAVKLKLRTLQHKEALMSETKKLFVVSDVHGYLPPLREALGEAGFDRNDASHVFICCGDLFDPQNDNEALCSFVAGLERKILILGDREEALSQAPDLSDALKTLIRGMKNCFETEKYLFVHGWIPSEGDFRTADAEDWHRARTVGWNECYGENTDLPEKTIVCGHIPTRLAYAFAPDWDLSDHGIYEGNGVIAVNGGVEACGRINVLVLEDIFI